MGTVSVNPPKTPVTKGSGGIAAATLPNVCKMPGPPAPFVPTPLPNIGKSGDSPKGYSKKVKVEGLPVAIKGASFGSIGDIASKATGGGIVSSNTQGPTKFIGPGSFDVKIEGKNVQLLSDPMLNNCGPSGSPANSATLQGIVQWTSLVDRGLDQKTADALCDAACKAMSNKGSSRTFQDAMAKQFADPNPPMYRPNNPNILPEVSQTIPPIGGDGMTTLLSGTGATTVPGGPTAPMSMVKAMRQSAPGTMTRWDFVIPQNPELPAVNSNIKHYVEVKFPGDKLTQNQEYARWAMSDEERSKIIEMNPAQDCICTTKKGQTKGRARP